MATITIKIDSDELAREVLAQLGYLPGDDDIPDLISVESDEEPEPVTEEVRPTGKTHVAAIHERMAFSEDLMPKGTRKMPDVPKQGAFCTTEEPKEAVEPVDNELGASLDVFSEETAKEQDALYQQSLGIHKSLMAEGRVKKTADQLIGGELMDYLNSMCEHYDEDTRTAAKAYLDSLK
jgi:hypothetical protein